MARKTKRAGRGTFCLHRIGMPTIYIPLVEDKDAEWVRASIPFSPLRPVGFPDAPLLPGYRGRSHIFRSDVECR